MSDSTILKYNTAHLSIFATTFLLLLKLLVGLHTNTISIWSESIHSAVDLLATLIVYYTIRKAINSPDANHHYGHGKFENISGTFEAMLIIGAALWIIYEAIEKYNDANTPVLLEYSMLVMLISFTVNYFVSNRMLIVAKKTSSPALEADALHLRIDMWTSGGVFISLLLLHLTGWYWIDSVVAIIVSMIILKSGYSIIKKNISELTDICIPKDEENIISEIIINHEQVISLCQLRTRFSGSYRLIDMRLTLNKNTQLERAHAICDQIEANIRHRLGRCDIMIHLEPDQSSESQFVSNN